MIERILERAMRTASGTEVVYSRSEATPVSFESDRLRSIRITQTSALGLRVIVDGRLGSAVTNDMGDIDGLVDRALESAAYGSPAPFTFPGPAEGHPVAMWDDQVPRISREELVEMGQEILQRIKAAFPEVLVDCGASRSHGHAELANSAGAHVVEEGTQLSVWGTAQRVRGTDILFAGHSRAWRARAGVDPRAVADRAIEKLRMAERDATISPGHYPVLFRPGALSVLLSPLRLGVSGRNVLKGDSPLARRLNERIADSKLTLTDDPLVDFAVGSSQFDSEGVARRRLTVIEEGVLRAFLYDLDTAARAGTSSTGHGVGCSFTNLIISPGTTPYAEMVRGIRQGLVVDGVIGAGQSNVMNGDFAVNVSLGYKVENGEVVGRVKNVMISGNAYQALAALEAVGSEPEWVGGSQYAPALLVGRLSVSSRG